MFSKDPNPVDRALAARFGQVPSEAPQQRSAGLGFFAAPLAQGGHVNGPRFFRIGPLAQRWAAWSRDQVWPLRLVRRKPTDVRLFVPDDMPDEHPLSYTDIDLAEVDGDIDLVGPEGGEPSC